MTSRSVAWGMPLRALRVHRPKPAERGARAELFGAGLEQAEQFWAASETVGTETSPLLLFYGLGQAGRAMCAAAGRAPSGGHGLRFKMTEPKHASQIDLAQVVIEPEKRGLAVEIAAIRNSPLLTEPATLESLIASLEGLSEYAGNFIQGPRPLHVEDGESGADGDPFSQPATGKITVWPVPRHLSIREDQTPIGHPGVGRRTGEPPTIDDIGDWLDAYPALAKLGRPTGVGTPWSFSHGGPSSRFNGTLARLVAQAPMQRG